MITTSASLRAATASRAFPPPAAQCDPVEWGKGRFRYSELPAFSGAPSATVHRGVPFFSDDDFEGESCWGVKPLDRLGRSQGAYVLVGPDTVQDGERPDNSGLPEPSGWSDAHYDSLNPANLYDHSHVAAWVLTGLFLDEGNLFTATTTLNRSGMKPYENRVLRHVRACTAGGGRVLYRVTPKFEGGDLVARGVLVEAASFEDRGASLRECAWCYNVRPGVEIDYATGGSRLAVTAKEGRRTIAAAASAGGIGQAALTADFGFAGAVAARLRTAISSAFSGAGAADAGTAELEGAAGVLTVVPGAAEFHHPGCAFACGDKAVETAAPRETLILAGYRPCEACRP